MSLKYRELKREALSLLRGPSFVMIFLLTSTAAVAVYAMRGTFLIYATVQVFHDIMNLLIGLLAGIVVTTYSITIVALQLTSTQFSPRVIRHLLSQDLYTQITLGSFLSWIIFCLIVKFWILSPLPSDSPPDYTAILWVNAAIYGAFFLLAVLLPHFILTIAQNINAAHIIRKIALHTLDVVAEEAQAWEQMEKAEAPAASENDCYVKSKRFGYIQEINYKAIRHWLRRHPEVLFVEQSRSVGAFLTAGASIFRFRLSATLAEAQRHQLMQKTEHFLQHCYSVGQFRSFRQDVHFGIRQIVDIAIRAISPAVNDPTTAINCLDYLGQLVLALTEYRMPTGRVNRYRNEALYVRTVTFDQIVNQAFDQIYHFGRHDYAVLSRTFSLLNTCVRAVSKQEHLYVLGDEIGEFVEDLLQQIEMETIQAHVSQVQLVRLAGIARRTCDDWLAKTEEFAEMGNKMRLLHEKIQNDSRRLQALHDALNS